MICRVLLNYVRDFLFWLKDIGDSYESRYEENQRRKFIKKYDRSKPYSKL
jgi:hypothetical protein